MQDTLTLLWIKLMFVFSILRGIAPLFMLEWLMTASFITSVVALMGFPLQVQLTTFGCLAGGYLGLLYFIFARIHSLKEKSKEEAQ